MKAMKEKEKLKEKTKEKAKTLPGESSSGHVQDSDVRKAKGSVPEEKNADASAIEKKTAEAPAAEEMKAKASARKDPTSEAPVADGSAYETPTPEEIKSEEKAKDTPPEESQTGQSADTESKSAEPAEEAVEQPEGKAGEDRAESVAAPAAPAGRPGFIERWVNAEGNMSALSFLREQAESFHDVEADRLSASLSRLEGFREGGDLSVEVMDKAVGILLDIMADGLNGVIAGQGIATLVRGLSYETDVEKARCEGEIEGRNALIKEKFMSSLKRDTDVPALGGTSAGSDSRRPGSIFDLASFAR